MMTFILLAALAMIALGALVLYKAVGSKGRVTRRKSEANTSGASVGRATGGGDN